MKSKHKKFIKIISLILVVLINYPAFATSVSAQSDPAYQLFDFNDDSEQVPTGRILNTIGDVFSGLKKLGVTIINGMVKAVKFVGREVVARVIRIIVRADEDNIIGSDTFPAGAIEYRIRNSLIEENSRIFVTFTSDTGGRTWHISEQVPDHGFTIRLSDVAVEPLNFDYWIVLIEERDSEGIDYSTALANGWIYSAEEVDLELLSDKENFKAGEDLIFRFRFVKNGTFNISQDLRIVVALIGPDRKEIDRVTPYVDYLGNGEFLVDLGKSSKYFKPGKHKLKILIEDQGRYFLTEQSFTWGVLAINVNKSIYLPSERAYIQMAVLKDDGHTICDTNLKLEILNPQRELTTLLTNDGIRYSGKCSSNNVTDVPDYFAYYQVNGAGVYFMRLTNLNNDYQITDFFEVRDPSIGSGQVPFFDIERIGPTRIYPLAEYSMKLIIKASRDFQGDITEYVPGGFQITTPVATSRVINGDNQEITWRNIDWIAGEIYELEYTFDAPDISPYLYLLGPLEIQSDSSIIFQEARQWQIASDEPDEIYLHPTSDSVNEGGTGGTCTGHYDCVNDQTANAGSGSPATPDDTNYVTTALVDSTYQQEIFGLDDDQIPNGNEIISIQVFSRNERLSGNGKFQVCYNDGSLTCSGIDVVCGNGFSADSYTWDFSASPKDKTWLNSLTIGVQAAADADACKSSQIYVLVTHQASAANDNDTMFLSF